MMVSTWTRVGGWLSRLLAAGVLVVGACLAARPMAQDGIPPHAISDLPHHVRHVEEYRLALMEGQFPPLVAPVFNSAIRVPLFQYYAATAFAVPGLLAAAGVPPDRALGLAIFLHALAGGACLYLAARALGTRRAAAATAGAALQLCPFVGQDLYIRGAYPECLALWAFPLALYPTLRAAQLIRDDMPRAVRWMCVASLAWGYLIPIHVLHAAMFAAITVLVVGVHVALDLRSGWLRAIAAPVACVAGGVLVCAWYVYPVARDHAELRVAAQQSFMDAGLASLRVLLSPYFRTGTMGRWAPQIGLHFAIAAGLTLALAGGRGRGRGRLPGWAAGAAAAVVLLSCVAIILWYDRIPLAGTVLAPLQWTYRLMIPAAAVGAICVAIGIEALCERIDRAALRAVLPWFAAWYVLALAPPYYSNTAYERTPIVRMPLSQVLRDNYYAPESTTYAFRGTDLRLLDWKTPGTDTLIIGAGLDIPRDGSPFVARVTLRAPDAAGGEVRVTCSGMPWTEGPIATAAAGQVVTLDVPVRPGAGMRGLLTSVRFDVTTPPGAQWRVVDLVMRDAADPPEQFFRLPPNLETHTYGGTTVMHVDLPTGAAGLYQLPLCYLPSNRISVNGVRTSIASADRFLTVLPLQAGRNEVISATRPTRPALALSAAASAVLLCGCFAGPWAVRRWRTRRTAVSATAA